MINQKNSSGKRLYTLTDLLSLKKWDYSDFSKFLGIHRDTLFRYRSGKRQCRFDMKQIKALLNLLDELQISIFELEDDWILDKADKNDKSHKNQNSQKEKSNVA